MTTFVGADFFVQSVIQAGPATVRVRFSHDPLALNPAGANDALNPLNYTITGPVANLVTFAAIVPEDPQAIDLSLSGGLVLGNYLVEVANVHALEGDILKDPKSDDFDVTYVASAEPLNGGTKDDSAEALIRKHLPSSMSGKAWDALIAAFAVGDEVNRDNAMKAFDQLFKATASDFYLDRKAGEDGLSRPVNVGMSDDLFRQLSIRTASNKLTQEALTEILEVFYGPESTRANVVTELAEPFVLADGDSLELLLDGKDTVVIVFRESDFNRILQATATEVAAAINRGFKKVGSQAYAVMFTDPETGGRKVRILSASLGLGSTIQVLGDRAQLGLSFPSKLTSYNAQVVSGDAYNWVVSNPVPGVNRIQLTNGGGTSKVDLSVVRPGDYVVFEAANSSIPEATYEVLDVGVTFSGAALVQHFDIRGDVAGHTFLQLANQEMTFFRPEKKNILRGDRTVVVAETRRGELEVRLPATTQAVNRSEFLAAYLNDTAALPVSAISRVGSTVTVETSSPHGLEVGDQLLVREATCESTSPVIVAGTTSGPNAGTADASVSTIFPQIQPQQAPGSLWSASLKLADGRLLEVGGFHGGFGLLTDCHLLKTTLNSVLPSGAKKYDYTWDSCTSLGTARAAHSSALLDSGLVLAAGGFAGGGYDATCELYTPNLTTGSWAATGSMVGPRAFFPMLKLTDGTVLAMGGAIADRTATASVESFNPNTGTWSAGPDPLDDQRCDSRAVVLPDGRVLLTGGRPLARPAPDLNALAHWPMDEAAGAVVGDSVGTYNLTAINAPGIIVGQISNARDFTFANSHATGAGDAAAAAALQGEWTISAWTYGGNGVILSYGGATEVLADNVLAQVERIGNTVKVFWENGAGVNQSVTTPNLAFQVGGWDHVVVTKTVGATNYDIRVYLNGVLASTFTNIANAAGGTAASWYIGRSSEGASTYGGMLDDICVYKVPLSATEVFLLYRRGLGNVAIPNGDVYSSCVIYDPGTNGWTPTGNMAYSRFDHSLTLLPNEKVLAAGGTGYRSSDAVHPSTLDTAELFDPSTGRWTPVPRMLTARTGHGAVYLADRKKVLVAGGGAVGAEYFDTVTCRWRKVPHAPTASDSTKSTQLVPVGDCVALHGGIRNDASVPNSFLFVPGEDLYALGGLNGVFSVLSVPSSTSFTYSTPAYVGLTTGDPLAVSIQPFTAGSSVVTGPYLFDPKNGLAVTSIETDVTQDLEAGGRYSTLDVGDASAFPDAPGWLAIAFGHESVAAPVPYLGKLSNQSLLLDYSYQFPTSNNVSGYTVSLASRAANVTTLTVNLPAGMVAHDMAIGQRIFFKSTSPSFPAGYYVITSKTASSINFTDPGANTSVVSPGSVVSRGVTVTLLAQKGAYAPASAADLGAAYLTASSAGRVAAQKTVTDCTAATVELNVRVSYPGDRGLGGAGLPALGTQKLSDKVCVWGGDFLTEELAAAREEK